MNSKPSIAGEFFAAILQHEGHPDSVAFLRSLVNSVPPTDETEYLDFKSASIPPVGGKPEQPLSDDKVKETWSEAVAGFATTSGGVLIWGIDARTPQGSKIDQASGFNLVLKPQELKARLKQLEHQAADPPVPGIRIEAFEDPNEGGKGFVVCYIPESDYKPHRSELAKGKRWLMRIGDSFVDIPPSVLRNLFFPHRRSYLFAEVDNKIRGGRSAGGVGQVQAIDFTTRLYNEGPATIEDLLVVVQHIDGIQLSIPGAWRGGRGPKGHEVVFPNSIHPGQEVQFCGIAIDIPVEPDGTPLKLDNEIQLAIQFYARDQEPFSIVLSYSITELLTPATKKGLPEPIPIARYR